MKVRYDENILVLITRTECKKTKSLIHYIKKKLKVYSSVGFTLSDLSHRL